MKRFFSATYLLLFTLIVCFATSQSLFRTSKCYDLLACVQYFDELKELPQFSTLAEDSVFLLSLEIVIVNTRASNLCNLYSLYGNDKNQVDSCINFISNMPVNIPEEEQSSSWIKNILSIRPQLLFVTKSFVRAGFSDYWNTSVAPKLNDRIAAYYSHIPNGTIEKIHSEMSAFANPEQLSGTKTNIYILDITNAFNLLDETFCCTPLLLDPELEKQYHLDFLKVYIHENLHRLNISPDLMERLNGLLADNFYKENEQIATAHNEGRNEAFVVAAEVYLSNKLGRRDDKSVFEEFSEYVDGSLVLAPIIYVHLGERLPTETYNDFLLRLFDNGTISIGNVEAEYNAVMNELKSRIE